MTAPCSLSPVSKSSNGLNNNPKIKVLLCTINIGNEEPNVESIGEMIPNDGDTKVVLQNQRYPIRANKKMKLKSNAICEISEDSCLVETLDKNEKNSKCNNGVDNENQKFDIIAVGMQEATFDMPENENGSLLVQKLYKMTTAVEQVTKDKNHNEVRKLNLCSVDSGDLEQKEVVHNYDTGQYDTNLLHQILNNHLPSYTRAVSYQRGQMRLMIFYNEDEISLRVLSVKAQNTGRGGFANKGGIVAECDINSGTRISFLTAHLEAHEGLSKYNTRCSTISDIFRGTGSKLADSYCDVSVTSHFTFAMGDLNFRTRLPNHEIGSNEHLKAAHILAEKKDWDTLNEHDELSLALRNKECLVGFLTPRCDFPPTFKTERKDGYDYISKRSPSYTDRILYKANHNLSQMIDLQAYGPIDQFTTSDHKPIRGAFEIQLNQKLSFRPLLTKRYKSRRHLTPAFMKKLEPLGRWNRTSELKARAELLSFSFSSIGCDITQHELPSSLHMPSPCVSFIPTPNDAIKSNNTGTTWKHWCRNKTTMSPLATKWPHTQVISNTLHPLWEKEIHFKIRSHLKCGTPVDLTGAMLHILVHDAKDNMNLIGSCSLNLASLIIDSIAKKEMNKKYMVSERVESRKSMQLVAFATRFLRTSLRRSSSQTPESCCKHKHTGIGHSKGEKVQSFSASANEKDTACGPEKVDMPTGDGLLSPILVVDDSSTKNIQTHRDNSKLPGKSPTGTKSSSDSQEKKSSEFLSGKEADSSQSFGITNLVLMKNGKEVGSIKFDIGTRWLS